MHFAKEKSIFFQYINSNIIIIHCFISVDIFYFPNNTDLLKSIKRREVSLICILYIGSQFIIDFSVGQNILSDSVFSKKKRFYRFPEFLVICNLFHFKTAIKVNFRFPQRRDNNYVVLQILTFLYMFNVLKIYCNIQFSPYWLFKSPY